MILVILRIFGQDIGWYSGVLHQRLFKYQLFSLLERFNTTRLVCTNQSRFYKSQNIKGQQMRERDIKKSKINSSSCMSKIKREYSTAKNDQPQPNKSWL